MVLSRILKHTLWVLSLAFNLKKNSVMKKIIIITAAFLGLVFTACENELDLNSPNDITTDQYWKTETDAQAGVNSIYAMFYKDGLWAR